MNQKSFTKVLAALAAVLLTVSAAAGPAMAASNGLNYQDGNAPNPEFVVDDVTIDAWDNAEFSDPLEYYDDSGDPARIPGEVNSSSDVDDLGTGTVNPVTVTATDIEVAEFGEFPRNDAEDGDNSASALDASEWTSSGATVDDATTAPNVDAVSITGSASSDSATYGNISALDSSVEKRYLQLAADITSASGEPVLTLNDSDGDYVEVKLYDADANASNADILANATGEGMVLQTQIGQLTTQGSGDGTMGEITEVSVSGDVTAEFSLLNAEKTSEYTFGEKYVDSDDDDELETETITEPRGEFSVHSVSTFGDTFSDAIYHGLSVPAHVDAEHAPAEDVEANFQSDNAYPQWDTVADIHYRLTLPDAYDVSYSGVSLEQTTEWPGTRYATVEMAEGVGDSDFDDISYSDMTSSFDAQDKDVTLDSTVSPGSEYAIHFELLLTGDEADAMQAAGGGAGVMGGGNGGGVWSLITSPIGALVSIVGGIFGGRKLGVF